MSSQLSLKGKFRINERLAGHTSFKVGGVVRYWAEPQDIPDLRNLVAFAKNKKMPLRIIGAGSNLLVNDGKIKGVVVKLSSNCFKSIKKVNQRMLRVGAGLSLARLVSYTRRSGLSGCELLSGIPGTVGGALAMNAGGIGDSVFDVSVMGHNGRIKILGNKDIRFGYRSSNLGRYIILGARLKLVKRSKRAIGKSINEYLAYRRRTQDLSFPSAGCVFKNPDSERMARRVKPSAAYFIERCGLKGLSFGEAAVSDKHANFIVNKGKAGFSDIRRLMRHVAGQVRKRFNVILEPEIKIWT
ncbi:MAG: UDP-N-acetylmuramate dehydrogenase [Candidatus Omnitrophota bacterium]